MHRVALYLLPASNHIPLNAQAQRATYTSRAMESGSLGCPCEYRRAGIRHIHDHLVAIPDELAGQQGYHELRRAALGRLRIAGRFGLRDKWTQEV